MYTSLTRRSFLVGAAAMGVLAAMPFAASASEAADASYPVTISNWDLANDGAEWVEREATYDHEPERVFVATQGTANVLIRLGLGSKIVGVGGVFGAVPEDIKDEFEAIPFKDAGYCPMEVVLGTNPDLVIGRGDLFADNEWGVGSVARLAEAGVDSFLVSCGREGAVPEDLFTDIEAIGEIFGIPEKAAEYVDALKARVAAWDEDPRWAGKEPQTFGFISYIENGDFLADPGSAETYANLNLKHIGLVNPFEDVPGSNLNQEDFLAEDPDIIFVFDYEGLDFEKFMADFAAIPKLQEMSAVKNGKVITLDFARYYAFSGDEYDEYDMIADAAWGPREEEGEDEE